MNDDVEIQATPEPKRRVSRGKAIALASVLAVAAAGGLAYYAGLFGPKEEKVVAAKADKYTCGMHPFVIADKPGDCPICGMTLTKIVGEAEAATAAAPAKSEAEDFFAEGGGKKERKLLFYRNPMNPSITSPVPRKDEMGMDYVPVYSDELGGGGKAIEGYATVKVGAESLRLAGVQTEVASRERLGRTVRTVGIVAPDETRVRHVHTKIDGWIEELYGNFTGQMVQKGQPLLAIYSPELLATQEEFLRARETAAKFDRSESPDVRKLGEELLEASRRRLELYDVPKSLIEEIARTGTPRRTVTLNAPVSGFVTAKGILEGQKVEPGMDLFTVTDLSRVWIEADVYEYEARSVKVGQEAVLTLAYDPSARLKGRVAYVYPYLSPESRTLKVRFEFPNPKLTLKPQMYADVALVLNSSTGVVIPDSALIDTGVRQIVFVQSGEGTFEPREVKVGVRGDGKAQILAGVKEGEKVVVRANFLLDSESKLRAALTRMTGGEGSQPSGGQAPGHEGHGARK